MILPVQASFPLRCRELIEAKGDYEPEKEFA